MGKKCHFYLEKKNNNIYSTESKNSKLKTRFFTENYKCILNRKKSLKNWLFINIGYYQQIVEKRIIYKISIK